MHVSCSSSLALRECGCVGFECPDTNLLKLHKSQDVIYLLKCLDTNVTQPVLMHSRT